MRKISILLTEDQYNYLIGKYGVLFSEKIRMMIDLDGRDQARAAEQNLSKLEKTIGKYPNLQLK